MQHFKMGMTKSQNYWRDMRLGTWHKNVRQIKRPTDTCPCGNKNFAINFSESITRHPDDTSTNSPINYPPTHQRQHINYHTSTPSMISIHIDPIHDFHAHPFMHLAISLSISGQSLEIGSRLWPCGP